MPSTPTWRWRMLAATAIAITTLAVGACASNGGSGTPTASPTTPNGDGFIGGAPSGSPTPSTRTGGSTSTGSGGGTSGPTFPKDAKSYGLAFLQAMAAGDQNRMKTLAVMAAVAQVGDGFYDNVNAQWTYRSCGPNPNNPADANQIACVYDNAHGDEITVVMNKTQLGGSAAVLEVPLEKTTYPNDAAQYTGEMLFAFENGNGNRVLRLSNTSVKNSLTCKLESHMPSVKPHSGDSSTVDVTISDGNAGHEYVFQVLAAPGNKSNAVKAFISKQC